MQHPNHDAIEIETGPAPRASILVLHGLGADGHDLAPVCEMLDTAALGPVRFVLPHAPVRPVTLNGGYPMRAWYDILGQDIARREDEAGLRESIASIEALVARERGRGIEARRIVLAGFSQGCAMALLAGLRHPEPLGGIAGLSGYLPLADATERERNPASRAVPIFLAHGSEDPVVAIERGRASRDRLLGMGHAVEWHEYPIEHTVSIEEIADLGAWLGRHLRNS